MLSASGLPVPFSIRESVEAETEVLAATSRRLRPSSSRRRRMARPNSSVLTRPLLDRLVRFMRQPYHSAVLDARLCIARETPGKNNRSYMSYRTYLSMALLPADFLLG